MELYNESYVYSCLSEPSRAGAEYELIESEATRIDQKVLSMTISNSVGSEAAAPFVTGWLGVGSSCCTETKVMSLATWAHIGDCARFTERSCGRFLPGTARRASRTAASSLASMRMWTADVHRPASRYRSCV